MRDGKRGVGGFASSTFLVQSYEFLPYEHICSTSANMFCVSARAFALALLYTVLQSLVPQGSWSSLLPSASAPTECFLDRLDSALPPLFATPPTLASALCFVVFAARIIAMRSTTMYIETQSTRAVYGFRGRLDPPPWYQLGTMPPALFSSCDNRTDNPPQNCRLITGSILQFTYCMDNTANGVPAKLQDNCYRQLELTAAT